MYWIIFIGFALLSWLVSSRLQSKFEKYSKIPMPNGMTGRDVAEKMLRDNGIYDVRVTSTPGHLTDHYNPATQTVNLSESVYYSNSIAAAAVAAHECGHAVQHATAYATYAFSVGTRCELCLQHHDMGLVGRYADVADLSAADAFWYHLVRLDHVVQLHHAAGRDQRQPTCVGMVEPSRHHQCLHTR